ncbi:MAG: mechanosensitive ion channel domain-containing protein [Rhodopila sp.]
MARRRRLLVGAFRALVFFERQPTETRFLQDLFAAVAYTSAVLAIIAYVFGMPVSGLLAASGVIAIVLGLALQSTLGDLFSGFVLNLSKPYHVGDWITLDRWLTGQVVEANWRATHILTLDNDLAIVPNSLITKTMLVNASNPNKAHGVTIVVRLEPSLAPSQGCAILEMALLSCNEILRQLPPAVTVRSLDAAALECEVQFFVSDYEKIIEARNEVFDLVYRHCTAAGIKLAPPPGMLLTQPPHVVRSEPKDAARQLLNHLTIFASLSEEERDALAMKMRRRSFKAGDILIEPGTVTQALSIVTSGALVAIVDEGNGEGEVLRFSPGDFFGMAGVLTGEPIPLRVQALTKAVVFEIGRDDLAPVLKEHPGIAAELAQIVALRTKIGRQRLERQLRHDDDDDEGFGARFAERMKALLGIE